MCAGKTVLDKTFAEALFQRLDNFRVVEGAGERFDLPKGFIVGHGLSVWSDRSHRIERIGNRKPVHLAAMHTNALERANQLLEMAKERIDVTRAVISEVSPAVGVHMGPGAVGFAYMAGVE